MDLRVLEGSGIALELQGIVSGVDAARNVNDQGQLEIDHEILATDPECGDQTCRNKYGKRLE